jgi:hypothetical protein
MSNVIPGNFKEKKTELVLTCTICGCQQFFLAFQPLVGDERGQTVAICAACQSSELLLKPTPSEEF